MSFAAMLEGKQICCYALLLKKCRCCLWPGKVNIISSFLTIFGFFQHLWCVLLSQILLKIVHLFIALKNHVWCCVHFNSLNTLPSCSNLQTYMYRLYCHIFHWSFSLLKGCKYFPFFIWNYTLIVIGGMDWVKFNQLFLAWISPT